MTSGMMPKKASSSSYWKEKVYRRGKVVCKEEGDARKTFVKMYRGHDRSRRKGLFSGRSSGKDNIEEFPEREVIFCGEESGKIIGGKTNK